jgi:Ca2+-dependent lipid-binding protein
MVKVEIAFHGVNLAAKDFSGKSDPYLVFKHENIVVGRSEVIYNHLDPVWKPVTLELKREDCSVAGDIEILIECWDKDSFVKSDDLIGASRQKLEDLLIPKHEIELMDGLKHSGKLVVDKGSIMIREGKKRGALGVVDSVLPGLRKLF